MILWGIVLAQPRRESGKPALAEVEADGEAARRALLCPLPGEGHCPTGHLPSFLGDSSYMLRMWHRTIPVKTALGEMPSEFLHWYASVLTGKL